MNKLTYINLLLLVVIVLLAAFLLLTRNDGQPEQLNVSAIDPDSIDQIIISRAGQSELHFSKQTGRWRMLSPLAAPANDTRIQAILSILSARSHTQLDVAGLDPDRFSLRSPSVTLKLNEHEFRFGDAAPMDNRRYLLYLDTVHLINDGLFQQLQQKPEFFILVEEQ